MLYLCNYSILFTVIQEESNPIHLSDDSSESDPTATKHTIISGKSEPRPVNSPPMAVIQQNKTLEVECDSGQFSSASLSSPDTQMDQFKFTQLPRSPPPGSLLGMYTTLENQTTVVPPLFNNGANVNYIPDSDGMSTRDRGRGVKEIGNMQANTADERSPDEGDTDAPVPTLSGSINTEAQQPRLDAAGYSPSACFTIGPKPEAGTNNTEAEEEEEEEEEEDEFGEHVAISPVPEQSQYMLEDAAKYLSSDIINQLNQIENLKKQNEKLKCQLSEEREAKEAIEQEKKEISDRFEKYQISVIEKEEAAEKILRQMERELEECKEKISEAEREKKEMESEHKERCAELQSEIDSLKKKITDEKMRTELETLRLENKLYKAEKLLSDKENTILVKEKEIAELEKKIADAEIQKLKKENKELRKQSLRRVSQSLSSMQIFESEGESID